MEFDTTTLILGAIVIIVIISLIGGILKRYRTCPSDKVMVVYGKVGGNKSAKCIHGGATFVWPIFQNFSLLDLTPFTLTLDLKNALSKQNIRINVPSSFTCAISTEPEVMQNAAERLLNKPLNYIMNLSQDIIIGQMRLIIATMDIEELNTQRDKFLSLVQRNVETELKKIGLNLINANITDIRDESGYIDALGKEAEAKALNEAKRNVAEKNREGNVGEKEEKMQEALQIAEKDKLWREGVAKQDTAAIAAEKLAEQGKRKAVADANAAAITSEKEAERRAREAIANENAAAIEAEKEAERKQREKIAVANAAAIAAEKEAEQIQRTKVAAANAAAIAAEKDAERDQRIRMAAANAEAVAAENEAAANIARSEANRREAEAEASARAFSAEKVQKANALAASYAAEQKAEMARAERQKATMQADIIVQAEIEKRKIEIAAEAEAESIRRKAKGAADAMLMKMQAEADGYKAQYEARGQGFDSLVKAAGGDANAAYQFMLAEKIDTLFKTQAEAIKNVNIDKITVWDSDNGSTTGNFINSLVKNVLPMKDVFNMVGIEMPGLKKTEAATAEDNKAIDVTPAKPAAAKPVARPAAPSAQKLNIDNL